MSLACGIENATCICSQNSTGRTSCSQTPLCSLWPPERQKMRRELSRANGRAHPRPASFQYHVLGHCLRDSPANLDPEQTGQLQFQWTERALSFSSRVPLKPYICIWRAASEARSGYASYPLWNQNGDGTKAFGKWRTVRQRLLKLQGTGGDASGQEPGALLHSEQQQR